MTASNLDAVAYDPAERRLRIRFRSGAIFEYSGVPGVVYEELLAARSQDDYFSEYIRPEYHYVRVRGAVEGVAAVPR